MKIKTYCFKNKQNTFVTVEATRGLDAIPEELKQKHGGLVLFREFEIEANEPPRIAFKSQQAIADIKKQGYHLHAVEIKFEETVVPDRGRFNGTNNPANAPVVPPRPADDPKGSRRLR